MKRRKWSKGDKLIRSKPTRTDEELVQEFFNKYLELHRGKIHQSMMDQMIYGNVHVRTNNETQ